MATRLSDMIAQIEAFPEEEALAGLRDDALAEAVVESLALTERVLRAAARASGETAEREPEVDNLVESARQWHADLGRTLKLA